MKIKKLTGELCFLVNFFCINVGKSCLDPNECRMEPSKFHVVESSKKQKSASATSFVVESSLGCPSWERRPATRSVCKYMKSICE